MDKKAQPKVEVAPPETWVERYEDYLYGYALSRLKDSEAAADCVQDTFMAGIQALHRFDGSRDIKFWLRGILRNKIVDQVRRSIKEQKVDNHAENEDILSTGYYKHSRAPAMPWQSNPRKQYDNIEFWEVFNDCIQPLKAPAREAFLLKFVEGQTTDEVCQTMNISPNYLSVLLHRTRLQLKLAFEVKWTDEDAK
jgi:RNA polymerase sigma-70 factor (ECF subfamily)